MDGSNWMTSHQDGVGQLERCLLDNEEVQLPEVFVEHSNIFYEVLSQETWSNALSEAQRQHLKTFLPKFPENDKVEKEETIRRLFAGEEFKFGNPLKTFQMNLRDGSYTPDIAKYTKMCRKVKYSEYKYSQQKYYSQLVREMLLSRQRVLEQLSRLSADESIKFDYVPPKPKENKLEEKVKRKYVRLLKEVRQECGVEDTSSEEEEASPVQRSKKQLFKSLCPIPSPEPTMPSVLATYSSKPPSLNGDINGECVTQGKRMRPISPVEVTEEAYRKMLMKHRKRCYSDDDEEHPEYNTQNITLQDIMARCQATKKGAKQSEGQGQTDTPTSVTLQTGLKKKLKKERLEKRLKKSRPPKKISEMSTASSSLLGEEEEEEILPEKSNASVEQDSMEILDELSFPESFPAKTEFTEYQSFFSLLRDLILQCPDHRVTSAKLEEKVREWQETQTSSLNSWYIQQSNWVEVVVSALKFLAGESVGMNIENFIPYLDYKERAQQWRWIGTGRDSDETLLSVCNSWLKHKGEYSDRLTDSNQGLPPPARSKTSYVVKPTTANEKVSFQEQERKRFENPHKAFTYIMHGYESVVGPVKGVYNKDNAVTKAREHALLVSNRPAYVTILTLVRDAAARLPNGEGTRGDICELLKDSQFLAPGVTDAQINVVVSGALDRLHSEKDPCVKYDVTRKLWIYLHRSRVEEEFEKIHQAQGAAVKAKKSLQKPKAQKPQKLRDLTSPQVQTVTPPSLKLSSPLSASSESLNVEDLSPQQTATQAQLLSSPSTSHSPRAVAQSPLIGQASPRVAQSSPKSSSTPMSAAGLRQVISNIVSAQAGSATSPVTTASSTAVQQKFTPAQLQLLQQAAQAQAAHAAGQAQVQSSAKPGTPGSRSGSPSRSPALSSVTTTVKSEVTPTLQKSISLGLLQGQGRGKHPSPVSSPLPQNIVFTSKPELVLQRQTSLLSNQSQGQSSPVPQAVTTASIATKSVTVTTASLASPVTVVSSSQASANPLVARLVQQFSGNQLVSVNNLLAAQRLQGSLPRTSTAIKIQGGSVVQPVTGGKPIHLTGKPMAQTKSQLLQLGGKGQQQLGLFQTPQGTISIIPQTAAGTLVTLPQTKSAGSAGSPDPSSTQAVSVVQPTTVSSQSKSTVLAGGGVTPTSVQVISQSKASNFSGVVSQPTVQMISQSKSAVPNQGGIVVTQLAPGGITLRPGGNLAGGPGSQGKVIAQGQPGLVPAQFVLQQTPASVKVTDAQSTVATTAGSAPLLVSSTGGKQNQNIQVVRTVLSQQPGFKPGQATILISQPALQQSGATVLPPGQVVQGTLPKTQGKTTQRGKQQPVFARIITPQTGMNMKFSTGSQSVPLIQTVTQSGGALKSEAEVFKTVNKSLNALTMSGTQSAITLTTGAAPSSSIATSQQILAAAAAGKITQQITESQEDS